MPASEQIQPTDPAARKKAISAVLAVIVIGVLTILAAERLVGHLRELSRDDPALAIAQARTLLMALAVLMALALGIVALWLLRFSLRIRAAERFPPPETPVVRPTRILTGQRARRRALAGMVLAILLALLGIAAAAVLWRVAGSLSAL